MTGPICKTGDLIEIEGRTARGGFAPNVIPEHVRKLGRAALPQERTIAYSAMLTGRYDCDYVGVVGVVQRAWLSSDPKSRVMFADVAIEDGIVRAAFWDYSSPADLTRFVDARVQLRGNIGTLFGRTEQLRGVSLFAGRIEDVTVLEAAPDPFSLPTRAIRNIYNYSSEGEVNRRIRVRGVVTARVNGTPVAMSDFTTSATFRYVVNVIYVKDGTAGVRIETEQSPFVRPGRHCRSGRFPGGHAGQADPEERPAPRCRAGTAPPPVDVAWPTDNVLTPDHDAEIVRMNGQLLSVLAGTTERVLVLRARRHRLQRRARHRPGQRRARQDSPWHAAVGHGRVLVPGRAAAFVPALPPFA